MIFCASFSFLGKGCSFKRDSRVVVGQAEYARLVRRFPLSVHAMIKTLILFTLCRKWLGEFRRAYDEHMVCFIFGD